MTITRDDKLWLYQLAETIVVAMRGDAMHLRETYKELLSGKEDDGDEREA